jgi:hypothetical protein
MPTVDALQAPLDAQARHTLAGDSYLNRQDCHNRRVWTEHAGRDVRRKNRASRYHLGEAPRLGSVSNGLVGIRHAYRPMADRTLTDKRE